MIAGVAVMALVGRPNVGKSALFNRLVGEQRAIVDDVPGVTRDRLMATVHHGERRFLCMDTGGFLADVPRDAAAMEAHVRAAALRAVAEADALVCVVDAQAGLLPVDAALVRLLARTGKPLLVAVNKVDTPAHEAAVAEFHRLGRPLVSTSAAHRRGLAELLAAVAASLPAAEPPADSGDATRLALIGRPIVGKSSLLNRLTDSERVVVSPQPGTTRDTIDMPLVVDGRRYLLVDTAGIRRRGRIADRVEGHGAVRALAALARADVVLLVLDATDGMTEQDARLAGRALEAGRGIVVVANKWDLLPPEEQRPATFAARVRAAHPGLAELPCLGVSARTGEGLERLFPLVRRVERSFDREIRTADLNRVLQAAVAEHAPPGRHGRPARLLYATQTGRRPPTITIFGSAPGGLPAAYRRYLEHRLASALRLTGVPLRLVFRSRHAADRVSRDRGPGSAARARRTRPPKRAGGRPPRR